MVDQSNDDIELFWYYDAYQKHTIIVMNNNNSQG
jgi:hypothetical protein